MIFKYGQAEIDHLKSKDKRLGDAIDQIGMIERRVIPDPFVALINSIVSQQISKKAAATVWNRLSHLLKDITPQTIVDADMGEIQSCGMTNRKAQYIKGIGEAAIKGDIDFSTLDALADEEIIEELTSLKGVGIWTAEMLLIFSLQRPNVISWGDLGIRRGMMKLYDIEDLTREDFKKYSARYSPYGSVASLYLWEIGAPQ